MVSFPQVSRPKPCAHLSLPPYVQRRRFIGLYYTISPYQLLHLIWTLLRFRSSSLFCRNVWIYLEKNNSHVECLIVGLFSKHVLEKLLFAGDANYLVICGSKAMDVFVHKRCCRSPASCGSTRCYCSTVLYVHKYSTPISVFPDLIFARDKNN